MKSGDLRNAAGQPATARQVLHREARTDWAAVVDAEARALQPCGCGHGKGEHASGADRNCTACSCSNYVPERAFGGEPLEGELRGTCCSHMEGVHRIDGTCSVPGCICEDFVVELAAEGA